MLKKIALSVLALALVFVLVGFLLPSTYAVERSVTIQAQPEAIHALVGDLRKWPEWTAWDKELDPQAVFAYDGDPTAVGGAQRWNGPKMGKGKLSITATDPAKGLAYALDFDDGKYLSSGTLTYLPEGGATKVTWTNGGALGANPINRWFGLLMDSMMGPDFEKGLGRLKSSAEQVK